MAGIPVRAAVIRAEDHIPRPVADTTAVVTPRRAAVIQRQVLEGITQHLVAADIAAVVIPRLAVVEAAATRLLAEEAEAVVAATTVAVVEAAVAAMAAVAVVTADAAKFSS